MGSEFSGDFPPCSTSSFGGDADMMYMPAAGTVFYTPLARPSRIDRLTTSLAGAEGAMALQKLHRHVAPDDSGTGDYALPRPDLLGCTIGFATSIGGEPGLSSRTIPAPLETRVAGSWQRELAVMQCLTCHLQ